MGSAPDGAGSIGSGAFRCSAYQTGSASEVRASDVSGCLRRSEHRGGRFPEIVGRVKFCKGAGSPALIDDIEQKKAQFDRLRPPSRAALAQLQKHYDVELTYTSNAIEGNTLTLRETAEVIEHGITVAGKSLRDHLEAVDHYEAVQWMGALAAAEKIGVDWHYPAPRRGVR
jgi:hypothetical protein